MTETWRRLKQRKLVQWTVAYLAASWGLLQVLDLAANTYDWPTFVVRVAFGLIALGFVVTLVLAWYHGERGEQKVGGIELLILGLLLAIGGGLLWRYAQISPPEGSMEAAANNTAPAAAMAPESTPNSIAVLPFVDMSRAHDQEYFSDGLSEELLNQLAQVPQLRVIARTSSFSFKGKKVDIATIAKALHVANILEGSVRKDGNTLRISAQLVRAADSTQLWSQTYDCKLTDIFKVQDDISSEVVDALKLKLLPAQQPSGLQHTSNAGAYQLYLLGKDIELRGEHARAVRVLRQAVAMDPGYANAWAELAIATDEMSNNEDSPAKSARDVKLAFAAAQRAIALAPGLGQGYASRGLLRYNRTWDWQGSRSDFERGYALDPHNVMLLNYYATSLFFIFGQHDEAIAMSRKATTIDPLSALAWEGLGRLLQADGQDGPADAAFRQAIKINPGATWGHYLLGYDELKSGNAESALTHFRLILEEPWVLAGTAVAEYTLGHAQQSQQALDALKSQYAAGYAFQIAAIYAWRGENNPAFEWLRRAYEQHDAGMGRLRYDPTIAPLRDDPRFAALVKKMDFPR